MVTITMAMKMAYSIIGTSLSYLTNNNVPDHDCGSVSYSMFSDVVAGLDLNQRCRCDFELRLKNIGEVNPQDPERFSSMLSRGRFWVVLPHPKASAFAWWTALIHIKKVFVFCVIFYVVAAVLERTMERAAIAYLEQRYTALEKEIADALRQSPTDDLAIADLKYRKLIIADEIQHNRRLVERFSKLSAQ